MLNQFSRTELLLGKQGMERLYNARVAVFGIGGVGGYTVEALARSGVGTLDLIDDDKVCLTNINRQIIATRKTVGQYKVEAAAERIHDINPDCKVNVYKTFYTPETASQFDFTQYDYVVDAIDTVTGKLELIEQATKAGTRIISCMGAGNKIHADKLEVTDIYKTSGCPLARVMRYELRKRRIRKLKVVYSKEPAMTPIDDMAISCRQNCICPPGTARKCTQRRQVPGSTAFVPAVAGLTAVALPLSRFLFPAKYAAGAPVIAYTALAMLFMGLTEYANKAYELEQSTVHVLQNSAIAAVIKVVSSVILLKTLGFTGGALGSVVAFASYFIITCVRVRSRFLFRVAPISLVRIIVSALLCGAAAFACTLLPVGNLIRLGAAVVVGAGVYAVCIIVSGEGREEVQAVLRRLKR